MIERGARVRIKASGVTGYVTDQKTEKERGAQGMAVSFPIEAVEVIGG